MEFRSTDQQLKIWKAQKMTHQRITCSLGKPSVTTPQAKRLGFSHSSLPKLHSESKDDDNFKKILKGKGASQREASGAIHEGQARLDQPVVD